MEESIIEFGRSRSSDQLEFAVGRRERCADVEVAAPCGGGHSFKLPTIGLIRVDACAKLAKGWRKSVDNLWKPCFAGDRMHPLIQNLIPVFRDS